MIDFFPSRQVALSVLSFDVHWYGILYLLAFLLAYVLLPRLARYRGVELSEEDWGAILTSAVIGVIVGGRLGYVLLYEPVYFAQNPLDIFKVWEGGMASHGGFLGVTLALLFVFWQRDISIRKMADVVVIPAAIGLALGRFGNFINQELYGTVTSLPWGMEFPGAEGARHPLQIYAAVKDLTIAAICFWYLQRRPVQYGRTFALFLMLYGVSRTLLEFIRAQQHALFDFGVFTVTRGQLYTVPILLLGIFLWWYWRERTQNEA